MKLEEYTKKLEERIGDLSTPRARVYMIVNMMQLEAANKALTEQLHIEQKVNGKVDAIVKGWFSDEG